MSRARATDSRFRYRMPENFEDLPVARAAAARKARHMALLGKQVRQLRSMAHHLEPVISIGKNNITDAVVGEASELLEARELIKGTVQEMSDYTAREAANELADRLNADVVQVIGRKFSLYRRSTRDDVEHIELA